MVSKHQEISEEIMDKYIKRINININYILCQRKLSEGFIERHKDRIN